MVLNPLARAELFDLRTLEPAMQRVVDVFQARVGKLELCAFEPCGHGAVFFPAPLAFDQQRQPFFEIQLEDVALLALFFEGLDHAFQAQGSEFFQRL